MEEQSNSNKTKSISRKAFLRCSGSVLAGSGLLALSGFLLHNRVEKAGSLSQAAQEDLLSAGVNDADFLSPYRLISAIETDRQIESLEISNGRIIVASNKEVTIYDEKGNPWNAFPVKDTVRDLAVDKDEIYVLYPTMVDVYGFNGILHRSWEACSDLSDYSAIAVRDDIVLVSDAQNKNIVKYNSQGGLDKFISSPNGFVIPSYAFDIVFAGDRFYCSNSGRHLVECYSLDGTYLSSFGEPGAQKGQFCGCCNPCHLTATEQGDLITSEKGIPRVSCYAPDGSLRNVLLNAKMMGGGTLGREVRAEGDHVYVAGARAVTIYRYDAQLAQNTSCASCGVNCPLKTLNS